jgi:plastocyanin
MKLDCNDVRTSERIIKKDTIHVLSMLVRHSRKMADIASILVIFAIIAQISFIHTVEAATIGRNSTVLAKNVITGNKIGNAFKVQAGRGDNTVVEDQFFPKKIEIKVGQSVTWYNPTLVSEPHTVTFILDNKSTTEVIVPFSIPNSTKFIPLVHSFNSQPMLTSSKNGISIVTGLNGRVFNPVAIDAKGNVKFMNANAHYNMTGSEKYVNSGWLLPKGQEQSFPGSASMFTVTFQKAGIYNYVCIIHPWMKGTITVK